MPTLVPKPLRMSIHPGQVLRWHLIFCVFYYQVRVMLQRRDWEPLLQLADPIDLTLLVLSFLVLFLYTFSVYGVLHRFHDRPWYVLTPALLGSTTLAIAARFVLEERLSPVLLNFRNYPADVGYLDYYLDNLYYAILHGAIGAIVFLLELTRHRERQRQELIVENQRTELAYLRAQVNPHFLFNTLNNIYSLFFQRSDRALRAVERLTVLLRYGLYEQRERVPLSREIDHLLNFIELEKMRYEVEPELRLDLPVVPPEVAVPPLLLITFVENAFKHGDPRQPIHIDLRLTGGRLDYRVENTPKAQQKDRVGGIGLDNLRKRLELIYGPRQELYFGPQGATFVAHLKIDLP